MNRLDPRAQLVVLAVLVLLVVLGGQMGLLVGLTMPLASLVATRSLGTWWRVLLGLLPLLIVLVGASWLAGAPAAGAIAALRLAALTTISLAFARAADSEQLAAGMGSLRVPYSITFVLVAGARFVPTTVEDLRDLRDAARLRGVTAGGSPLAQLRGWSVLLVPLVVATIRRGLQLGEAMEARGFDASPRRTVRHHLRWRPLDMLVVLAAVAVLAAILALSS